MSELPAAEDRTPADESVEDIDEFVLADFIVLKGFVSGPDGLVARRLQVRLLLRVASA